MVKIELVPDLEHCIEKTAKSKYAEFLQILLENKTPDADVERKLETLRLFLETADFPRLRSESEKQLIDGKKVRFLLYLEDSIPKCEMHVT
jgi:hypothetical protein